MAEYFKQTKLGGGTDPEMAQQEILRYKSLKSYRSSRLDSAWQTLSNYYLPNISDINTEKTEGTTGWSDRIFDTTGIEDAQVCTTGQSNWATPAAEPWFAWMPPKFLNMEEDDEGAIWCAICTEIALNELARSNYYAQSGIQYLNRTVFGTGQLHIEEGRNTLLTCFSRKIATYCIGQDDEGNIDTIYSEWEFTARQAAQKFGLENLSEKVLKAYNEAGGKGMDTKFTFLHVIRPRSEMERESGKIDAKNKAIASIYIAVDDKVCVRISGYDEMPDSVTRFADWGTGTAWGYSPAFLALPNVRQLNYLVRFTDAQLELRANPRILTPAGLYGQIDLRPGGITAYDPNNPAAGKPEEWMTQADLLGTEKSIEQKQQAVHRLLYVDTFKALSQMQAQYKTPPTAYQIQQILGESIQQLSPMFGRIISEKTDIDLRRIFGICYRAGKFPPAPRSMYIADPTGKSLRLVMPEVSYTSRLAIALRSQQNRATMETMQFVEETVKNTGRVDLLDNYDMDGLYRNYSLQQGMSGKYLRPFREVIAMRDARAKAAAAANALAAAESASKSASNLGSAPQPMQDAAVAQLEANVPA